MNRPLFRDEAVANKSRRLPGSILLAANGIVVPDKGINKVLSPQAGTVVKLHVSDGQEVKSGDPLFSISSERMAESENRKRSTRLNSAHIIQSAADAFNEASRGISI